MMLRFPTYGVSLPIAPSLRGLRGMVSLRGFGDVNDPCVNADGTINDSCVASQSVNEAASIINQADTGNAGLYAQCESNLAENNAQRAGLNLPALPDTCAAQFPANANVTVYTGYGNVQSGSGSAAGGYYYGEGGTPTVIDNQVATANAPASAAPTPQTVTYPTVNAALPAQYQTPQSQANAQASLPTTASASTANPLLGTTNMPTPASTSSNASGDLMIGGFDVTRNWIWLAAGGVALLFLLGGKR